MTMNTSRRTLLRSAFVGTAGTALGLTGFGGLNPIAAAAEAPKRARTVAEVIRMTPVEIARESEVVQTAYKVLLKSASQLKDAKVRETVTAILKNPDVTLDLSREADLVKTLKAAGYLGAKDDTVFPPIEKSGRSPQPTWSAPGSGYGSHHAYPGGLVVHVALNVLSAEKLLQSYADNNRCYLSVDDAVGGELLHDLHKPWVFAWQKDNSCRKEETLAMTGEHHVLSLAESMHRGLPATFCTAQACAHEHPGSQKGLELVVGWIKCAAIIAGVDPVEKGYLAKDGKTLPEPFRSEGFVVHLADHDWVLSVPACQWTVEALKRLMREKYGVDAEKRPADFNALRNYVLANLTAMRLHAIRSSEGEEAFAADVARVLKA